MPQYVPASRVSTVICTETLEWEVGSLSCFADGEQIGVSVW